MTIARKQLVDPSVTRWYHCVTRCVRRAFLLGEGPHDRKEWIEQRLQELAQVFVVAVGGFSVLCKDSRWEAICFWSITRAGFSARARPRFRVNYPESSIGWAAARRAGGPGWRS